MRVALDEIVAIGLYAKALQPLLEGDGSRLTVVVGDDHRTDHESSALKFLPQAEHVLVVSNAEVGALLVLLDICGTDNDNNLNAVANFLEHAQFAVWQKPRQHAACVVVVEEFSAELQIKFSVKL